MFYSHEILTSRKHGVATIWLIATLGAKSNTKKLTRKAICDVDVRRACDTIIQPEAPMALRLQGNLLYGVTRVYSQQCGYVLSDVQAAQANIRELYKTTQDDKLDPKAGKAIPGQLVLVDDPAFLPDMALPFLELDFLALDDKHSSQRSSQSMMSICQRSASEASQFLPNLELPSSSNKAGVGQYQLSLDDPFDLPSTNKSPIRGTFDDEALMYQDDLIFEFDADGNIRDIPPAERGPRSTRDVHPLGRLDSDPAASRRVWKEHDEATVSRRNWILDDEGDLNMIACGNEGSQILPNADAFLAANDAFMSGALQGGDGPFPPDLVDYVYSSEVSSFQEPSSISADAPQKQKKAKAKKAITDYATALVNNDLICWRDGYLENMAAATLQKTMLKANLHAKKNGFYFVCGSGLNGVGDGLGSLRITSPLDMFSGQALLARLTSSSFGHARTKHHKRDHAEPDNEEQEKSPKRPRHNENQHGRAFEGNLLAPDSEELVISDDRSDVEIGRGALSALADHPSSSIMPWNVSSSLHSQQRILSSLHDPAPQIPRSNSVISRRRLNSISPLVGRDSALPGELESFAVLQKDDNIIYGRDDMESLNAEGQNTNRSGPVGGLGGHTEYEMLYPALNTDTQMAGASQWVRQALDRESDNFFEYVKNSICERSRDELNASPGEDNKWFVTFSELFHTESVTSLVAAQAFHHVLSLATKGRIWAEQLGVDQQEMDDEIRIGVVG